MKLTCPNSLEQKKKKKKCPPPNLTETSQCVRDTFFLNHLRVLTAIFLLFRTSVAKYSKNPPEMSKDSIVFLL